jgi:ubiquinone/menaquinone biosynthesis C-methylase UbiE
MPFKNYQFRASDKNNPLFYSLGSRLRVPYLLKTISNLSPVSVCLDLGCGIGFFSGILANFNFKIIGIDPDPASVEKAKKFYQNNDLEFFVASAEKLPVGDDLIDFVVCSEVLEHVKNLNQTLKEVKRVSKSGAKFFITVPSREGFFGTFFLKIGHSTNNLYEKDYRQPFTYQEIRLILEENNFSIDKYYYSKFFFSEIFMGLTKIIHQYFNRNKDFSGQADINIPPRIYKIIFPLVLIIGRLEDFLFKKFFKGHMIVIEGRIKKINDY